MSIINNVIHGRSPSDVVHIVVLGDSLNAKSFSWDLMWPSILENNFNRNGIQVKVTVVSVNAHTLFRINNTQVYGDLTALQKVLSLKDRIDIVMLVCGYNDIFTNVDGRNLTQIQSDFDLTTGTIKTLMPWVKIVYVEQLFYDNTNFDSTNLKNKGIIPSKMTLPSVGINANLYSEGMLEDLVDATSRARVADWETFQTYVDSHALVDGKIVLNGFQVGRLSLMTTDGTHVISVGHVLIGGDLTDKLLVLNQTVPLGLDGVADQTIGGAFDEWENLQSIFDAYLMADADGYTVNSIPVNNTSAATFANLGFSPNLKNWFMPYKGEFSLTPLSLTNTDGNAGQFKWELKGAPPNTQVELSVNGAAYFDLTSAGNNIITDNYGNAGEVSTIDTIVAAFSLTPPTIATFQFKVGDCAYEVKDVNIGA